MSRAGRSGCSGQVRGVQSLGGRVDLDGESVSRVNASLKVKISSTSGAELKPVVAKVRLLTRLLNL